MELNCLTQLDAGQAMDACDAASIDLIYLDPPFFTQKKQQRREDEPAYGDEWESMDQYLKWLRPLLARAYRLLKPSGSLFLHLDWHAVHYARVMLDEVFGANCFLNEVIWSYRSGGGSKKRFGRKHDTILFYARDPRKHRFFPDAVRVPYDAVIAKKRAELFHPEGKVAGDVWDIPRPPNHSKEWLGYPTQKPEALLERIILCCTERENVVADFCCGSGTTLAVSARLGRSWIGNDQSYDAIQIAKKRLANITDQQDERT